MATTDVCPTFPISTCEIPPATLDDKDINYYSIEKSEISVALLPKIYDLQKFRPKLKDI